MLVLHLFQQTVQKVQVVDHPNDKSCRWLKLHHRNWGCGRWGSSSSRPLCICASVIVKGAVALLPAWLRCGNGRLGSWLQTLSSLMLHLVKPGRDFSFQAFSMLSPGHRRSPMELQEMSAAGLLLVCYFLSTVTLWVTSPSFIALNTSVNHFHLHL